MIIANKHKIMILIPHTCKIIVEPSSRHSRLLTFALSAAYITGAFISVLISLL